MHNFKRLITAILLTLLSVVLLFSAAFAYLIVTPLGGKLLLHYFKQAFSSVGLLHVGHYEGSLQGGFVLQDVRITGLSYMPDALVRIQEIQVRLPLWQPSNSDFFIFNARLFLPDSDPIVFTGEVQSGQIKGNLYATSVDLHSASRFWAIEDIRKNLKGFVSNVDLEIQGPLTAPQLAGHFQADSIRYKSILLTNGFSRLHITLTPPLKQVQVQGQVMVDSARVNVHQKDLQLSPSKFTFQGAFFNPAIDIHLGARVEDMDIHLTIKGTSANPQLAVTSDPPMPPQEALRVLFTGNAWASSTSPFSGVTSSELAENFLNYSLEDMSSDQNVGFKTRLTDNLKLGAEMDQVPLPPGETSTYYYRKINGEMDLTNTMSLNVSREILPQDSYPSYQASESEPDTQVYVQYKKRF